MHGVTASRVFFDSGQNLYRLSDRSLIGKLEDRDFEVLSRIAGEDGVDLQIHYAPNPKDREHQRKCHGIGRLSTILYGPKGLADDMGNFLDACCIFLQDPVGCDRNVPYLNPHRLSSMDEILPLTFQLADSALQYIDEPMCPLSSLLSGLETSEALPMAETPRGLKTALYPYALLSTLSIII